MKLKINILILILVLSYSQILAQSERPETIVIPVSSLGEVTETRKQILQNSLEENLKDFFMVVSQERFEKAQEAAFEELEYEECTEEQCIVLIQEMLQVENVFALQLIVEGNDTQLSLSWRNLDEKKKATDICRNCDSFELNNRISKLVKKLVDNKSLKQASNLPLEDMRKKVEEEERLKREKEERLNKEEENRKIKEHEKKLEKEKIERERQTKIDNIKKEEYFKEFNINRNSVMFVGWSHTALYYKEFDNSTINDNTTLNVSGIRFEGINFGLRYYLKNNISLFGSFSSTSMESISFQKIKLHASNFTASGSSNNINLGGSYHWYFTSWDLYLGGGISNYNYNSKYADLLGTNYEMSFSRTDLNGMIGFDKNFMNNISINVETIVPYTSNLKVEYSNNPNIHKLEAPYFVFIRIGYNM